MSSLTRKIHVFFVATLIVTSLGCHAEAHDGLPTEISSQLLRSVGVMKPWSTNSYPQPSVSDTWLVEAYEPKRVISPEVCASRLVTLEVVKESPAFRVIYQQSEEQVALKPCAESSTGDFRSVTGDVNLAELPSLIRDVKVAAHCSGGCREWGSVTFADERLKAYLDKITLEALINVSVQRGETGLFFHADISSRELLVCYIRQEAENRRSLRVSAEPID